MTSPTPIDQTLTLISLEAENVKKLRAVLITPDGEPVFTIGGKNGAGKSTVIDCLKMSFMGGREIPSEPIRHGERHAMVRTVLGHRGEPLLTIELDMSLSGKPRLVVKNAEGTPISSPQTVLNTLYEHIGFDPLEFSRFDKDKQRAIIMRLAGLDFTELDVRLNTATEARKVANRLLKEQDAKHKGMPSFKDTPAEETTIAEVLRQLSTARAHNDARKTAVTAVGTAKGRVTSAQADVAEIERQLGEARASLVTKETALAAAEEALAALAPAQDTEAFEKQAETAEETNKKVRANAARAEIEKAIREHEAKAATHDQEIDAIAEEKLAAISKAKFPIPELKFDITAGLLLNGAPLDQASDGEKLRLSVAIAIALNPKLKILLIKQGNLLDAAARRMVAQMAHDAGAQVIMEIVSEDGAGCSVFIEEGELKEPAASAAE